MEYKSILDGISDRIEHYRQLERGMINEQKVINSYIISAYEDAYNIVVKSIKDSDN